MEHALPIRRKHRQRISLGAFFMAFSAVALSLSWAIVVRSHLDDVREAKIAAKQARAEAELARSIANAKLLNSAPRLQLVQETP